MIDEVLREAVGAAPGGCGRGVVGNMKTVACISQSGVVEFLCYPRFDSPTVFASLLDEHRGGHFVIRPAAADYQVHQAYLSDTNVLTTRFSSEDWICEITDFMPVSGDPRIVAIVPSTSQAHLLVRSVRVLMGEVKILARCAPRYDYGTHAHHVLIDSKSVAIFRRDEKGREGPDLALRSTVPLTVDGPDITAHFTLNTGMTAHFVLGAEREVPSQPEDFEMALEHTVDFWRRWAKISTYKGRYRAAVMRSALTLKLLCSEHGGIVAAATFGLPEARSGERRWDYRYVWIRDAAFTVYAFLRLGYVQESRNFMGWIGKRNNDDDSDGSLRPMYAIDGGDVPEEEELTQLVGSGSHPLLIGNGARDQLQLDLYGALIDAVYLFDKYGDPTSLDGWAHVCRSISFVLSHWNLPDEGIWEFRDAKRHLLHSRVMCWVAIDRALRIAVKRSLNAPLEVWRAARDSIREDVLANFWNGDLESFVRTPGSAKLDASVLMMPLVRFIGPTDPRWLSTLRAIGRELTITPFVFRYLSDDAGDGLDGKEGAFMACSFWYAEALTRAGLIAEGQELFERLLGYGNHLGLFSEQVSTDGTALGNEPQALTHLALISAAFQLDRSLGPAAEM